MKKYIHIFIILAFVFGLFSFSAKPVNAYDAGCTGVGPYSTLTGQLCVNSGYQGNGYIPGCTALGPYSNITGQLCTGSSGYQMNAYIPGCIGGSMYSTVTGQLCYGSPINPTNPYSNKQFYIGQSGADVLALQQMLSSAGFYTGRIDGYYGPLTDRAYIAYKAQYTINPIPVDPCLYTTTSNYYSPINCPIYGGQPTISGVSGPQTLSVNQTGTWTVNAYNQYNQIGNLSYSVNWGDQIYQPLYSASSSLYYQPQQNATFTHSYSQVGTYTATFTVTNNSGQTAQSTLSVVVGGSNYYGSAPVVYSLSPVSGSVGTQVTIYGTGFNSYCPSGSYCTNSANLANSVWVKFGSATLQGTSSYDGTTLTFIVPSNLNNCSITAGVVCTQVYMPVNPGVYAVSVMNNNGTSNSTNFTVTGGLVYTTSPTIYSLSPSSGLVGSQVTIRGTGLIGNSGCVGTQCTAINTPSTINFGGGVIQNVYSYDGGSSLTFNVPSAINPACLYSYPACGRPSINITPGVYPVSVTNVNGVVSNSVNFTVTPYYIY